MALIISQAGRTTRLERASFANEAALQRVAPKPASETGGQKWRQQSRGQSPPEPDDCNMLRQQILTELATTPLF